jgi:hypothetical protein
MSALNDSPPQSTDLMRETPAESAPAEPPPQVTNAKPRRVRVYGISHLVRGPLTLEPDPEPTMTSQEAWAAMRLADTEGDLDDFKVFFLEYVRNDKSLTFADMEKKFRLEGLNTHLIALVRCLVSVGNVGTGDSLAENDQEFAGRDRYEVPCLVPIRGKESSNPVATPLKFY